MLLRSQQEVTCPHCGETYGFEVYRFINADKYPESKEKVRNRELFQAVCPQCRGSASVSYSFMYLENGFLFHVVQDETDFQNTCRMIRDETGFPPNLRRLQHRIMRTREELLEKLAIFDAGMDDRLIELLKVVSSISLQKQQPEFCFDEIYFAVDKTRSGNVPLLQFNDRTHGRSATLRFDAALTGLYNGLSSEYGEKINTGHAKDFQIDIAWAARFFQTEGV